MSGRTRKNEGINVFVDKNGWNLCRNSFKNQECCMVEENSTKWCVPVWNVKFVKEVKNFWNILMDAHTPLVLHMWCLLLIPSWSLTSSWDTNWNICNCTIRNNDDDQNLRKKKTTFVKYCRSTERSIRLDNVGRMGIFVICDSRTNIFICTVSDVFVRPSPHPFYTLWGARLPPTVS